MRLSIWQQFSSNHSADFTVVGQFASEAAAERAMQEFRRMFNAILEWHSRPENQGWRSKHLKEYHDQPFLTPPEAVFAQKYDVEWLQPIDWYGDIDVIPEQIQRAQNQVFVAVDFETWQQPDLIRTLMQKLGAVDVKNDRSETLFLSIHLTCKLPQDERKYEICEQLLIYLFMGKQRGLRNWKYVPWKPELTGSEEYWKYIARGKLERRSEDGRNSILMLDLQFDRLGFGFPPLLHWLEEKGCTEINYTVTEDQWQGY